MASRSWLQAAARVGFAHAAEVNAEASRLRVALDTAHFVATEEARQRRFDSVTAARAEHETKIFALRHALHFISTNRANPHSNT